jgi:hypothetical protein
VTCSTHTMDNLIAAAAGLLTAPVHRTAAGGVEVVIVRMLGAVYDQFTIATRAAVAAQRAERVRELGRDEWHTPSRRCR